MHAPASKLCQSERYGKKIRVIFFILMISIRTHYLKLTIGLPGIPGEVVLLLVYGCDCFKLWLSKLISLDAEPSSPSRKRLPVGSQP